MINLKNGGDGGSVVLWLIFQHADFSLKAHSAVSPGHNRS